MRRHVWLMGIGVAAALGSEMGLAAELGGRWPHRQGQRLTLSFRCVEIVRVGQSDKVFNYCGRYYNEVKEAARIWTQSGANVDLYEVFERRGRFFPPKIKVGEASWNTWPREAGVTQHRPCPGGGCGYTSASIWLNGPDLSSMTPFDRMKVIVHEFGHAIGLAHTENDRTESPSVMFMGLQPVNTPQPWDVGWVNHMYP